MFINYTVTIEEFAKKYYLKSFRKKYKKSFDIPWNAFILMLQKLDLILERESCNQISDPNGEIVICKAEFKIMPNESTKSSGNRCIVAQDKEKKELRILFVYCKNDIRNNNETIWWKDIIRKNYPIYKDIL